MKSYERVPSGYKPQTASTAKVRITTEDAFIREAQRTYKAFAYLVDGIRIVGLDRKHNGNIYEVYNCDSREAAIRFLRAVPAGAIPPLYYVVVETPHGNIGKDISGIFDEATGGSID